jgi:nucleoid-associated protein YgaU
VREPRRKVKGRSDVKRRIAFFGLALTALSQMGCQQSFSFGAPRQKPVPPSQSIENLMPQQMPATAPSKPAAEVRPPAMLAVHEAPPQPKDQYAPAPKSARVHTVQAGETLFSIARQYYGDQRQWRRIYQANKNRLQDPQNVRVGMKLIVP